MSKGSRRDRNELAAATHAGGANVRDVGPLRIDLATRTLAVNLQRLEAPGQVYDADYGWMEHRPGVTSLVFAKRSRESEKAFGSLLEVRFPVENCVTLWDQSADFIANFRPFVHSWPREALDVGSYSPDWPAARSHSEWASVAYMAHSGSAANLDFYNVSPAGMARLLQHGNFDIKITAIVRVSLTIFALSHLLDELEAAVEQIKRELPDDVHRRASGETVDGE